MTAKSPEQLKDEITSLLRDDAARFSINPSELAARIIDIIDSAQSLIGDGSIEPVKANVSTLERKRLWREGFYSAQITRGFTFPQGSNLNDLHIFDADVASGLTWREYDYSTGQTTMLTSAKAGDVAMMGRISPSESPWFRVGNIRPPDSSEIRSHVADWAEAGNGSQIPGDKLLNATRAIKPVSEYLSDRQDTTPFRVYRGDGRLAAESDTNYTGEYLFVIKDLGSLIPEANRSGDNAVDTIDLFIADRDGVENRVHAFDNFSYAPGAFIRAFEIDAGEQRSTLQDVKTTPGEIRFQFRFRSRNVSILSAPIYSMPIVPGLAPEIQRVGTGLALDQSGVLSATSTTLGGPTGGIVADFTVASEEGVPITHFENYAPLTGRHRITMNMHGAANISDLTLSLNDTPVSIALTRFEEGFNSFIITVPPEATAAIAAAQDVPEFTLRYRPIRSADPVSLSYFIDIRGFGFTFPTDKTVRNDNLTLGTALIFQQTVGKILQLTQGPSREYQMPRWQDSTRWDSASNDAFGFENVATQPDISQIITCPEGSYFEYLDGVKVSSIVNHSGDRGFAAFRDPSTEGRFFVRPLPGSAPTAVHIAPNRGLQYDDQRRLELTDEARQGAFRIGVHPFSWERGSTQATTIHIEIPFAKPGDNRLDNVDKIRVTFNGFAPQDVDFTPSSTRSGLVEVNISALNVGTISGNIESTDNEVDIGVALHATDGDPIGSDSLVLSETIRVPVIRAPRLVLQEAVNATSTAGVTSITIPVNYTDYTTLTISIRLTDATIRTVMHPTAIIAAQTDNGPIDFDSLWTRSTRVISLNRGRIIFAELHD